MPQKAKLYRVNNRDLYYGLCDGNIHFVVETRAEVYLKVRHQVPSLVIFHTKDEIDQAVIDYINDWEDALHPTVQENIIYSAGYKA